MFVYAVQVGQRQNPFAHEQMLDAYVGHHGIVLHRSQAIVSKNETLLLTYQARFRDSQIVKLDTIEKEGSITKSITEIACRDDIQAMISFMTVEKYRQQAMLNFWKNILTIPDERCPNDLPEWMEKMEVAQTLWPRLENNGQGDQYTIM